MTISVHISFIFQSSPPGLLLALHGWYPGECNLAQAHLTELVQVCVGNPRIRNYTLCTY